jgi:hypothetical protein
MLYLVEHHGGHAVHGLQCVEVGGAQRSLAQFKALLEQRLRQVVRACSDVHETSSTSLRVYEHGGIMVQWYGMYTRSNA